MRLLIIGAGHEGEPCGIVDYLLLLAKAAAADGADVIVFTLNPVLPLHTFAPGPEMDVPGVKFEAASDRSPVVAWAELRKLIGRFQPDLISLQLPLFPLLYRHLVRADHLRLAWTLRASRAAVTLHETWIHPEEWIREPRSTRNLMRQIDLMAMLWVLRPAGVFVSSDSHRTHVRGLGLNAEVAPVFSNIPRLTDPDGKTGRALITEELQARGLQLPPNALIVVLFGRIPPTWSVEAAANATLLHAEESGRPAVFVSIGRVSYGETGWARFCQIPRQPHLICRLGLRSPDELSQVLGAAELALTPTPLAFWRKSGTCAALVDHGVRLVFSDPWPDESLPAPPKWAWCRQGRLQLCAGNSGHTANAAGIYRRIARLAQTDCDVGIV